MPGQTFFKRLVRMGGVGSLGLAAVAATRRFRDNIHGTDGFSEHTRQQRKEHWFSGMHKPLLPTKEQRQIFQQHFSRFAHLLPDSYEALRQQQALKTPVHLKPLSECPVKLAFDTGAVLAVGGPPALFSAAAKLDTYKVIFLNDERRWPTWYGSAFHLEHDAPSESPTSYMPATFLTNQILRAVWDYQSYESIEATGQFPWRTLDWSGWLSHPEHWPMGFRLAFAFQLTTMAAKEQRQQVVNDVVKQCQAGENFYHDLNKKLGGKLLLPGKGSYIVARNGEEVSEFDDLQRDLAEGNRTLTRFSKQDMVKEFGLAPEGLQFAKKTHDMVLSPNHKEVVSAYIQKKGGQVINGTLTTVYTDGQQAGGIAEYRNTKGQREFIPFSQLIMSLGSQPVMGHNNKPLFDMVAARGVSTLAYVYVPPHCQLPLATVCGGTNHLMNLVEKPVETIDKNGKKWHLYLTRITAAACITPNVSEENSADYDSTAALGQISAVRLTLPECQVEPFFVSGCNRLVSKYGQTHWESPYAGIHIHYGAGGGGLTRAPDFSTKALEEPKQTSNAHGMSMRG